MKKVMLWIIGFVALSGGALRAQDIAGIWQGTLVADPDPGIRTLLKISAPVSDSSSGTMYRVDQPGWSVPITAITLQGKIVKFAVPQLDVTYEGKLSVDGASITGTWAHGTTTHVLNLAHVTADTAWEIPKPPPPPKPMAADASPTFEVATIKPSNPDTQGKGIRVNGRQFSTLNTTLDDLIEFSYGVHARQIVGGPDWLDKDKFDISAVPDGEGQPNDKQWKGMIQKLLADRFQLTFHRDKKELSAYALTVGKSGQKLTKNESNGPLPGLFFRPTSGGIMLSVRNATMADFAGLLQAAVLDRPVVDQTGLKDRFDFSLSWAPDDSQFGGRFHNAPASDNAPPGLFTAIQEQIGLKLDAVKTPVEVLMIDKVARPSDN